MGYNSTIVVMNDALSYIEEDPNFGKNLVAGIQKVWYKTPQDVSAGGYINAATVLGTDHADSVHAYLVGANHGKDMGHVMHWGADYNDPETAIKVLHNLARNMGLEVTIRLKR